MNAYELADQVEMWGEDLLALNMKGGIPVVQGAKMLRQQAGELEYYKVRDSSHIKIIKEQENRITELEKDLYMIQRHYDQLETFSPSGKNAQTVSKTDENLQNGKV